MVHVSSAPVVSVEDQNSSEEESTDQDGQHPPGPQVETHLDEDVEEDSDISSDESADNSTQKPQEKSKGLSGLLAQAKLNELRKQVESLKLLSCL